MWESLAIKNRSAWREHVRDAEDGQLNEAETKRDARKARAGSASTTGSEHTCPTCGKVCRARIGLLSHAHTDVSALLISSHGHLRHRRTNIIIIITIILTYVLSRIVSKLLQAIGQIYAFDGGYRLSLITHSFRVNP